MNRSTACLKRSGRPNHQPYRHFQAHHLTAQEIEANKQEVIELLQSVKRENMDQVILYLKTTPFFEAPNAIHGNSHHKWPGGLAQHCLGVCRLMLQREEIDRESAIVVGLLHDISKANVYERKANKVWTYRAKPLHWNGDGSRSVKLLTTLLHLKLTPGETEAILHHMHRRGNVTKAILSNPLYQAIRDCDRANSKRGD